MKCYNYCLEVSLMWDELKAWLGSVVSFQELGCPFGLVTCWRLFYWWTLRYPYIWFGCL